MCCTFRALENERGRRNVDKDEWWNEEEQVTIEGCRE